MSDEEDPGIWKLSVRMITESFQGLNALKDAVSLDRACRMWNGKTKTKKPTKAAIVNALVLWFRSLPIEDQRRAIAIGMAEYNRLVRIEGAVQLMDKAQFEVTLKTPTDPKPTKKKPRTRSK